jgi:hypothetical protein
MLEYAAQYAIPASVTADQCRVLGAFILVLVAGAWLFGLMTRVPEKHDG